jgi:hypothetical protein
LLHCCRRCKVLFVAARNPSRARKRALFVGRVTSRRPGTYALVAFFWALLIVPVSFNAAVALILPYSLTMAVLAGWGTYCIATNRAWQLTVTKHRITWDRTFGRDEPHVVITQDIVRLSVDRSDTDGGPVTTVTLHLRDGSEREIPTWFTTSPDDAAVVQAIQRAVPKAFTRHVS